MAYCDPRRYWDKDQAVYEGFINKLADFCEGLIRDHHRLRLLSSELWFDAQAMMDLEIAIKSKCTIETSGCITCEPAGGIDEFLSQLAQVDCIVTCKFHGVVFGHLLNVPVLALAHHPKVSTLMGDFGLSEYCVDIREFDGDLLKTTFTRLVDNMADIKSCVPKKVKYRQGQLAAQFDQLFQR
jgi:polysaccharide pyruvyl transferase WcaK-like protein